MQRRLFLSAFVLLLIQCSAAFCMEPNLYAQYSGKTVKTYIADVKDASKEPVDVVLIKLEIEKGLKDRKSIKFQIVPAEMEADISIQTQIVGFIWSDHDPVDMIVGIGGTAMDAAVVEDYASLEADVTVTDVRKNQILWKSRLFATETKKQMSKIESIPLVTENFVKVFIKNCFSKRRK